MRSFNVKMKSNEQITSPNTISQIETNPKTIAEAFNKFFSTIAKDIDTKIMPTSKTYKGYLHATLIKLFF